MNEVLAKLCRDHHLPNLARVYESQACPDTLADDEQPLALMKGISRPGVVSLRLHSAKQEWQVMCESPLAIHSRSADNGVAKSDQLRL